MKIVGLTGGIASGKSTVSKYLARLGAVIIDADILAREVVQPGEKAYTEIVEFFGTEILDDKKQIERKLLAAKVFNNNEALKKLNSIIHPAVIAATKEHIEAAKKKDIAVAVVDAPLLIEAGMTTLVDEVWVVSTEEPLQIERAMKRDGLLEEQVKLRIAAQMPLKDKRQHATRVIDNTGTLEDTYKQVERYFSELFSE